MLRLSRPAGFRAQRFASDLSPRMQRTRPLAAGLRTRHPSGPAAGLWRLSRFVQDQAQIPAFLDMYWLLAAAVVMAALAFTLKKNDSRAGAQVAAH
jgi:hypothetical protein